ncbi:MAG: hypothetical protein EBR15_09705, partial [Gammaproteobacteria bacterium]|nr:hypothetical protein [Gammaproteobacteria bacterium]
MEHEALASTQRLAERELATADEQLAIAQSAALEADAALSQARDHARDWRDKDTAARAEARKAEEEAAGLAGRVNAIEGLERERVGLAPGAARLLKDREQFGEGAVLGPLSDYIGADANTAMLVERFLGPTVHAVVIRDAAVATAVRAWHGRTNPGALLLLPLDVVAQLPEAAEAGELSA